MLLTAAQRDLQLHAGEERGQGGRGAGGGGVGEHAKAVQIVLKLNCLAKPTIENTYIEVELCVVLYHKTKN